MAFMLDADEVISAFHEGLISKPEARRALGFDGKKALKPAQTEGPVQVGDAVFSINHLDQAPSRSVFVTATGYPVVKYLAHWITASGTRMTRQEFLDSRPSWPYTVVYIPE